uniref:RoaA n=1 Tax=Monomorphina parapyrum TaxID=1664066 RepID=A0A0G3VH45_9EUGL|nr:RoaA [Monomorphina parapyrum]AKL78949.1 RoaA [Monomorphina parapyrum]
MYVEDRVFFLQKSLNSAIKFYNVSSVKRKNAVFFNSFSVRLKAVKDCVVNSSLFVNFNTSLITGEDFINVVLGLGNRSFDSIKLSFYLIKGTGQSFYFLFSKLFNESVRFIWDLSLSPFLEILSGKVWQGFRPFRELTDSLFSVKNILYKVKSRNWILKKSFNLDLISYFLFHDFFRKKSFLSNFLKKDSFYFFLKGKNIVFLSVFLSFLLNEFVIKSFLKFKRFDNFDLHFNVDFFVTNGELYFFSSSLDKLFFFDFLFHKFTSKLCLDSNMSDTKIFSVFNGFNFIGWKVFIFNNFGIFNIVSLEQIRKYKRSLKSLIVKFSGSNIFLLLKKVNSVISTWLSHYNLSNYPWDISSELDLYLYKLFWRFVCKRHSRKSTTWIYNKYWKFLSGKWRFFVLDNVTGNILFLRSHEFSNSKLYRLPSSVNVFDCVDNIIYHAYWFDKFSAKLRGIYKTLFIAQHGVCPICKKFFNIKSFSFIKISKLVLFKFNSNKLSQLVLVHNYCYF